MVIDHQRQRARERYGVEVVGSDLAWMAALCRDGCGARIGIDPRRGYEQWIIRWAGREVAVVYERSRNHVVTLAPWAGREEFELRARARVTRHGQLLADGWRALAALVEGGAHGCA